MITKNIFLNYPVRSSLGITCLGFLTIAGCVVASPPVVVTAPAPVVVAAAPVVVESDLVYYPDYEVYFDPGARVYWYSRGGAWVNGPSPVGISVDVLLGSPSIHTGFRDSPQSHHTEISRQYPRNWRPTGHEPVGPGGPRGSGPGGPGDRGRRG